MKKRQAQILYKAMLPHLPELVTDGRKLLLFSPIGHTLRALLISDSSYTSEDFYFHWFFMPLCISRDYIILGYGERLKAPDGTTGWSTSIPDLPMRMVEAVRSQALPHLQKLKTEDDVIAAMRARVGDDINALQYTTYLHILQRRFDAAEVTLNKIIADDEPNDRQWKKNIAEAARFMLTELHRDPESTVRLVKKYQDETLGKLKLEQWR
jgi:hypothetical protein